MIATSLGRSIGTKNKAVRIRGYIVYGVAVIGFVLAVINLTRAIINVSAPLYSGFKHEINLASFEIYKVDPMKNISEEATCIPSDNKIKSLL